MQFPEGLEDTPCPKNIDIFFIYKSVQFNSIAVKFDKSGFLSIAT